MAALPLLTVGHGPADRSTLTDVLAGAGVELLVDVRRFPGSRRHPDVGRDALATWLPEVGIEYAWEEDLGGRRSLPRDEAEADTWWRVAAFRGYAAHTRTDAFRTALARVLEVADAGQVAVMCSESVWWRCHRRIIADVVELGHGRPVRHLMPDGRLADHRPAAGARVVDDGVLVWDGER